MDFLNSLKLDQWWKIVLWLGVISIGASLIHQVTFISNKHLFGLGIGLILIGISHAIAFGTQSEIKPANAYTGSALLITHNIYKHTIVTYLLFTAGVLISTLFLTLLLRSLI